MLKVLTHSCLICRTPIIDSDVTGVTCGSEKCLEELGKQAACNFRDFNEARDLLIDTLWDMRVWTRKKRDEAKNKGNWRIVDLCAEISASIENANKVKDSLIDILCRIGEIGEEKKSELKDWDIGSLFEKISEGVEGILEDIDTISVGVESLRDRLKM